MAKSSFGGGVTLITHGFNSDVASWIVPMQGAIGRYGSLAHSNTTCYTISITRNAQSQFVSSATYITGTNPIAAASGELLIKLDWSTLSTTLGVSTIDIATAAVTALRATNLIADLNGHALVEQPLHLAGHSRGGSVAAEMARLLGAQGIWVDQVTTLDPVPVGFPYGDPTMRNYANVFYADNYWQDIGSPSGDALAGAYNRELSDLSGGDASPHTDVHLWYHGTIDFRAPITVDSATITSTERANWWTVQEQAGTNAGFRLSLIGGGNRFSTNEPTGAGNGRINDGVNRLYDFGAGLAANRTALPANNGAWPNVILFSHSATNPVAAGTLLPISLHYQSGTNPAAMLALALDRDANPYNGNETLVSQIPLGATGTGQVFLLQTNAPTDSGVVPATYRLLASVTASGRTRYYHAPLPVTILPGAQAPWLTSLGLTNGVYAFRVNGQIGQTVVTEASSNLMHWVAISTNELTVGHVEFTDPQTAATPGRYFRAVLAAP